MKLTSQQTATVLAALRLWQQNIEHRNEFVDHRLMEIATNEGEFEPLSAEEIDELCEELNVAPDEGDVFCRVCGEDHQPPVHTDEFPEPGEMRETGR